MSAIVRATIVHSVRFTSSQLRGLAARSGRYRSVRRIMYHYGYHGMKCQCHCERIPRQYVAHRCLQADEPNTLGGHDDGARLPVSAKEYHARHAAQKAAHTLACACGWKGCLEARAKSCHAEEAFPLCTGDVQVHAQFRALGYSRARHVRNFDAAQVVMALPSTRHGLFLWSGHHNPKDIVQPSHPDGQLRLRTQTTQPEGSGTRFRERKVNQALGMCPPSREFHCLRGTYAHTLSHTHTHN